MRSRKPYIEEPVDSEKWAIPYADLLTLLLALFVVMYSVSSVNAGKFKVLASSLNVAFNGHSGSPLSASYSALTVVQPLFLLPPKPLLKSISLPRNFATSKTASPVVAPPPLTHVPKTSNLSVLNAQLTGVLAPWIKQHSVVIHSHAQWLKVEIRTDVLFPSGNARLNPSSQIVLSKLAQVLAPLPNPIRIAGFTDNIPIHTSEFPSNWELSAARAGSVARLFQSLGINPARLALYGWGANHPLASNTTSLGRQRNRRIAIVILANQKSLTPISY